MKKVFLILSAVFIISCNSVELKHENERLNQKVLDLQVENTTLKAELSKYEMNPELLLSKAKDAEAVRNIDELQKILMNLTEYHPNSKEKTEVSVMVNKLQELTRKEAEEVENKRLKAVNNLKRDHDDVSGVTWYKNPYFTHYNNRNLVSVYIGERDNVVWLRLKMSYTGSDWIFFDKAFLSYHGNTIEIKFDKYEDKKTEIGNGGVWEWIDVSVNDSDISFIKNMAKVSDSKMRLSGKYSKTRNLSANERKAISDVLLAYEVMKNR